MKRQLAIGGVLLAVQIWCAGLALAAPWEDGMAAYNRGDYVPALQVFRAMAREGNTQAQVALGTMYKKGRGVRRSSAHAFMWLTRASAGGNARAKSELRQMSQNMTSQELTRAKEMMLVCEASNYGNCEY